MNLLRYRVIGFFASALLIASCASANSQPSTITQVVILGSGTPNPDPSRSGPAIAIVVNDTPYIVDFGPGVVRRAASLSPRYGGSINGLDVKLIKRAFLTHLHSDHTLGFADLILTPWVMGRNEPLQVYGPQGIVEMSENLLSAYKEDINHRRTGAESANDSGWRVTAKAVEEGLVYEDANVSVEAFAVQHGSWSNAFGYRFTTPDRVIVISGDTTPSSNLEKFSRDADILVHQAYSAIGLNNSSAAWQNYMQNNHTSTHELAEIASRVNPGLLVLYHVLLLGSTEDELISEVTENYSGEVVIANDRDVF